MIARFTPGTGRSLLTTPTLGRHGTVHRDDLVDLLTSAGFVTVSALVMGLTGLSERPIGVSVPLGAMFFLMMAMDRIDPAIRGELGGRRGLRRFGRSLRSGVPPEDADPEVWLRALAEWPNMPLLRRRFVWVMGACVIGVVVSMVAAVTAFLTDSDIAFSIFVQTSASTVSATVMAVVLRSWPWGNGKKAANVRAALESRRDQSPST